MSPWFRSRKRGRKSGGDLRVKNGAMSSLIVDNIATLLYDNMMIHEHAF